MENQMNEGIEKMSYVETLRKYDSFEGRIPEKYRWTEDDFSFLMANITRRCNLSCSHCFVACSPDRTEFMSRENLEACLDVVTQRRFKYIDITGGAPETHPDFEWFIREAARREIPMTLRSNLCILAQPEYAHLPELYAELGIEVVASLPHYQARKSEKQRGVGTFDPTIQIIKKLNDLGYGKGEQGANSNGKELVLNLVFNPAGAVMPPSGGALEAEYKKRLSEDHGIVFNSLYVFTNVPAGRFGQLLEDTGLFDKYMGMLMGSFNPATVPAMQCRTSIDVAPDGRLYDCEFNQSLGLDLPCTNGLFVRDLLDPSVSLKRKIAFANHCYSCTAASGGS